MSEFNPSSYDITKALIISYDGKTKRDISQNFITGFVINQSMDAVNYSGSLKVLDTAGVLEGMPIRGEESLELWIKTYDTNTEIKINTFIHSVTDIVPTQSSNGVQYVLHFISRQSFMASTKKIVEGFKGNINEMVKSVFAKTFSKLGEGYTVTPDNRKKTLPYGTEYYPLINEETGKPGNRKLFVQKTDGITQLIIPDLAPTETMFFLASRAFNPKTPSQTFRFFETLENYYFCTDEYFIKDVKESEVINLFYAPVIDLSPTEIMQQLNRIETLQVISKGVDTSTDLFSGSYRNEVVEIDLIRRRFDISKFNFDNARYIDMTGSTRNLSSNPHTEDFRKDIFREDNAKRFIVFRDYQRPGDIPSNVSGERHFAEIVHNRVSYYHHLNNTSIVVSLKGRLDIRPGMIANVDIKMLDGVDSTTNTNKTLSGRYLIQSTSHSSNGEGTLMTSLKLAKFDWSGTSGQTIPETGEGANNV